MNDESPRKALIALLLLLPAAALAQEELRPERLYISPHALGSGGPRVVGLAGAFVGVAERAEGLSSNVAALAQRHPLLYGNWDFDGTFSWLGPIGNLGARDVDNDGRSDGAVDASQWAASFMLQIRRFGIGAYYRANEQKYCSIDLCPQNDYLGLRLANAGVAAAFSFLDDGLIVGGGLYSAQAELGYHGEKWSYLGNTGEVDVLVRPNGLPFRLGAVFRPEVVGSYQPKPFQSTSVIGRPIYQAVVSPAVLTAGASLRFGEGARHYNRLSPKAREVIAERVGEDRAPPEVPYDAPFGTWLVSMQLELIFPVRNAISGEVFSSFQPVSADPMGQATYVVPRLGIEHDTVPGRLRLRGGTWFEPSPFEGRMQRAHVSAGADLRLGRFIIDWSVYAAADVSERSYFYTVGVQVWQGPTPFRKPKALVKAEEDEAERREEEAEERAEEEEERREQEAERRAEEEERGQEREESPAAVEGQ